MAKCNFFSERRLVWLHKNYQNKIKLTPGAGVEEGVPVVGIVLVASAQHNTLAASLFHHALQYIQDVKGMEMAIS